MNEDDDKADEAPEKLEGTGALEIRDERGRFLKGHPIAKLGGRPKGSKSPTWKTAVAEAAKARGMTPGEVAAEVCGRILDDALAGNPVAQKLVADRLAKAEDREAGAEDEGGAGDTRSTERGKLNKAEREACPMDTLLIDGVKVSIYALNPERAVAELAHFTAEGYMEELARIEARFLASNGGLSSPSPEPPERSVNTWLRDFDEAQSRAAVALWMERHGKPADTYGTDS